MYNMNRFYVLFYIINVAILKEVKEDELRR